MIHFREFHNAIRVVMNIDRGELVDAGVMDESDHAAWRRFEADPFRFFISLQQEEAERFWYVIDSRLSQAK